MSIEGNTTDDIKQPALIAGMDERPVLDFEHREAQSIFEFALRDLPFGEVYAAMLAKGFRWRQAAFVAWSTLPESQRQPKTKKELAELLGCSTDKIGSMARDPRLNAMRLVMARAMYLDALPDIVQASIDVASESTYKATPERNNIINKVLGLGQDTLTVNVGEQSQDFSQMSDAELAALAADEGLFGDDE